MRRFSAKSELGFIWALSFEWKSRFLQFLSAELTENKIKSMPEILAPRSFKWCIVCSFVMLSCWEDAFQAKHPFFHTKMKTFISQQRSSAEMFGLWFYDVLGLPQPLIPLTQNRYVDSALWDLDQLLINDENSLLIYLKAFFLSVQYYISSFCRLALLFPLPLFRGSGSGNSSSSANRKSKNFQHFTSLELTLRVYITCVFILVWKMSRKCKRFWISC